ncbi:MAG: hypothetical protein SGARI_000871 [Bacillariaceae sp.]
MTGLLNTATCTYEKTALALLPSQCVKSLPQLADYTEYFEGIPKKKEGTQENNISWLSFPALQCQGLFCYRIDKDHVLLGGALTDGGSVIQWARELLDLWRDDEKFEVVVKRVEETTALELKEREEQQQSDTLRWYPVNSVPCMVPFLSGERSTGFRSGATGAMMGLTRQTTPESLLQGCFESISLRLKAILDLIAAHGTQDEKPFIIASGRAMEVNNYWRQMISDTSGLRVVFDGETKEGTSRGVARLVAMALNGCSISSFSEPVTPSVTSEPRSVATAMYKEKAEKQNALIDAISPLF